MTVLKATDLNVYYNRAQAIHDISITINKNEIVGIIGPNGAGKTTLLNVFSGLKAYNGSAMFLDEEIENKTPTELVDNGLIQYPERRDLYPHFDVEENIKMGAHRRGRNNMKENLERVYSLFPRLDDRRKQKAKTMSGGEQQMLAIGRALMSNPVLLMLDEPTLGLAPVIIDRISDTLRTLANEDMTILLAEQNASFALDHAERLYLLETGEISLSGEAKEFKENSYIQDAYMGIR